ncbi:ferredoxin [Mycobacterium tuberculosis]|nr:ferredoxin [Mycobacterium tuberculosis]
MPAFGVARGATGEPEIEAVVDRVEQVADQVVAVTWRAADGRQLPQWTPGAHIDVELAPGVVRQYSLCGDPADRSRWRIAVLRERRSRGGSARIHTLGRGERLWLRGPRNNFELRPAHRYVFIAGGIGITPILPMVRAADAAGTDWCLHYGGRNRRSMAFADELARYGSRVVVRPQDEQGLLDVAAIVGTPRPGTLVYCCGPEGLLAAVTGWRAAWPPGHLHTERFRGQMIDTSRDSSIDVECRASGITVTAGPDESVLEALERAGGVVIASSCREGVCGTCEATVLDGVPDHRDSILSDEERAANDVMMTCVSRARTSRLVLDI